MDGWETIGFLLGRLIFGGELLVFGEGISMDDLLVDERLRAFFNRSTSDRQLCRVDPNPWVSLAGKPRRFVTEMNNKKRKPNAIYMKGIIIYLAVVCHTLRFL